MRLKRFSLEAESTALVVEDVMTTGITTKKTINELENRIKIEVLPVIGVLVNRSGSKMLGKRCIISLIEHPMPIWEESDCHLCKGGSKAIRPKEHWDELTNPS